MTERADEQLVIDFLGGDQHAFTELANRHRDYLVKMVTKRCRDYNGAEDIVQKALIKIYRHVGSFDPAKLSFKQWACMIATNCFVDAMRTKKAQGMITNWHDGDPRGQRGEGPSGINPPDPSQPLPETRMAQEDVRDKFWAFVDGLPLINREAICLIFVDGLTYRDAAEKTGIPFTTLQYRVSSVLPALVEAIGEAIGEAPENLNITLERRHEKRIERPNPFYSVPRTADTFTLREHVESLPEQEFQVCHAVCYQGMSVSEASDVMGIPEETIDGVLDDVLDRLFRRVFGAERRALAA